MTACPTASSSLAWKCSCSGQKLANPGFESGAIYSEECRNPRKTVARATYIAVALVATMYARDYQLFGYEPPA